MTITAQENLNAYWNVRSEPYDEFQLARDDNEGYRQLWVDLYREWLPAAPASVLDVGTGSGYVAMLLAELGYEVTATDLSEGMLERARAHAARLDNPPTVLAGDAVEPDFAEGSFDVVTNRYLMWTLREPERALIEWRRVLRPGGMIALVDSPWYHDGFAKPDNTHFSMYYNPDVRQALPLAGASSIEPTQALVESAGYSQVTVTPLHTLLEKSLELGLEPREGGQLQYLITARA